MGICCTYLVGQSPQKKIRVFVFSVNLDVGCIDANAFHPPIAISLNVVVADVRCGGGSYRKRARYHVGSVLAVRCIPAYWRVLGQCYLTVMLMDFLTVTPYSLASS